MKAANIPLDLNGIMGLFGKRSNLWKIRVWTPGEMVNVWNGLSAIAPGPRD